MKYIRAERFKKSAVKLPHKIQAKVAKVFLLFTFHYEGDACVFRNIGLHEIVEREP